MREKDNIDKRLKEFVQRELAPAKIVDVRTEEIEGVDGEPLLRIWVVYTSKANCWTPRRPSGFPGRSDRHSPI